jgi:hypothetical protein
VIYADTPPERPVLIMKQSPVNPTLLYAKVNRRGSDAAAQNMRKPILSHGYVIVGRHRRLCLLFMSSCSRCLGSSAAVGSSPLRASIGSNPFVDRGLERSIRAIKDSADNDSEGDDGTSSYPTDGGCR